MRRRNVWTTDIQECHRLASRQLEEPTQLQRDDTAPWEQLPYECRIYWNLEGTERLKQRSLEYIRSQPDNTYYTDGSSDGCNTHKSLTAVNILINRKRDLNTITRVIRDAASRLTQRATINWIHTHTGIPVNENAHRAVKIGLHIDRMHTTVNAIIFIVQTRMKEEMARHYNEQPYNDASQQTMDHRRLHQTDSARKKLMSIPRKVQC